MRKPLNSPQYYKLLHTYNVAMQRESGKADREAILGDGNGRCYYPNDTSYYYVRYPISQDEDGENVVYGSPTPVKASGDTFRVADGAPVMVRWQSGRYVVTAPTVTQLETEGINPASLNLMIPERQFVDLRYVTLGYATHVGTSETETLEIFINHFYYYDDSNIPHSVADSRLDLASYVPAADVDGNEKHCLVGIFLKNDDTWEVVSSTPKYIEETLSLAVDVTEIMTLASARATPLVCYKLVSNQTLLNETDKFVDLRQWTHPIQRQDNYAAIVKPTVNDDISLRYEPGSVWINTTSNVPYFCTDNTDGNAKWSALITQQRVYYVETSGGDFDSIQDAIDAAVAQGISYANPWIIQIGIGDSGVWSEDITLYNGLILWARNHSAATLTGNISWVTNEATNIEVCELRNIKIGNGIATNAIAIDFQNASYPKYLILQNCFLFPPTTFTFNAVSTPSPPTPYTIAHAIQSFNCVRLCDFTANGGFVDDQNTIAGNITLNNSAYLQHYGGEINATIELNDSSNMQIRHLPLANPNPFGVNLLTINVNGTELSGLDVNTIAWQSGNKVRYTFSGSPDLSTVGVGDWCAITSAGQSVNDGNYQIVTVDDVSKYIEIANDNVHDNTYDEGAGSPAVITIITEHPLLTLDSMSSSLINIPDTLVKRISVQFIDSNSAGVVAPMPTVLDNGDGSITVFSFGVFLFDNSEFVGSIKRYNITGDTFTLTDQLENYLIVNYNSGVPILQCTTSETYNESDIIPVRTYFRDGTELHFITWDTFGEGLPNKTNLVRILEQNIRFTEDAPIVLGQAPTRLITISSGIITNGAAVISLDDFNSSTDDLYFYKHVAGVWTKDMTTTQFNNSQYDNGTNLVALTGNQWTINWIYRGKETRAHGYYILGNNNYATLSAAQLITTPPTPPTVIATHAFLVGRIIVQNGATTGTVESVTTKTFTPSAVTNHNDLANIQIAGTGITYGHVDDTTQTIAGAKTFSDALQATGGVIFNEAGGDFDFRAEGDTNPNLLFVDASLDLVQTGNLDITSALSVSGDIAPSEITSDQNDYNPTGLSTASTLNLSSDADWNITGLAGGADGRVIIIRNIGNNNLTLIAESLDSTEANRFDFIADITLGSGYSLLLQYDTTDSRWKLLGSLPASTVITDHSELTGIGIYTHDEIDTHIDNISNPHSVTASQAGAIALTGNESVDGVKTFTSLPESSVVPTTADQLVNKAYADSLASSLRPVASCRVATTVAGTLATSFEDGDTIDGVVIAENDRILIKNQVAEEENGIYIVAASGAPSRATDYDSTAEADAGSFTFIEEGSDNASKQFVQITNDPVIDTDPLVFILLSALPQYTASNGVKFVSADIQLDLADTNPALEIADGGVRVKVDGTTINRTASGLTVLAATSAVNAAIQDIDIVSSAQTAQAWANQPVATTELFTNSWGRFKTDLTYATHYRLVANQSVTGYILASINLQYSTDNATFYGADNDSPSEFYMSNTASGVGAYYTMYTADTGEAESSVTNAGLTSGNDQLLAGYITEAGQPAYTQLSAGKYGARIVIAKTVGTRSVTMYWTLTEYKVDTSEVLIMTSSTSAAISTKATQALTATLANDYTLAASSRLVLKIYANVGASGTDVTVVVYQEGTSDSRVIILRPGELNIGSGTGIKTGAWAPLTASAKADNFFRIVGKNGNAVKDPTFRQLRIQLKMLSTGGAASPAAQYVTLATDSTLTNERVLTAGDGITVTDNGAGSTVEVKVGADQIKDTMIDWGTGASQVSLDDVPDGSSYARLTATQATDLTDGGATTLHKHDHGGLDGLADDDHSQYALLAGRDGEIAFNDDGGNVNFTIEGDTDTNLFHTDASEDIVQIGKLSIKGNYTFPVADGNADDIQVTDGAGNVSWRAANSVGSLIFIEEKSLSAATSTTFTGLTGDKHYLLKYSLDNAVGSASLISIRINGDANSNDYNYQYILVNGTSQSSLGTANSSVFTSMAANQRCTGEALLDLITDGSTSYVFLVLSSYCRYDGTDDTAIVVIGTQKNTVASDLTQIEIISNQSSSMNGTIALYKYTT